MRLFTAIDLPEDLRARFTTLLDQLRPLAKLQWSPPEKLHVTTMFIGEWPETRLDELHATLAGVTSPPIPISAKGLQWMNKRVLTAGIQSDSTMGALASATTAALAGIGHPVEDRAYHPHLTLARNKKSGRLPALEPFLVEHRSTTFGSFVASRFALFLSHGGKYTQLKEYVLSK